MQFCSHCLLKISRKQPADVSENTVVFRKVKSGTEKKHSKSTRAYNTTDLWTESKNINVLTTYALKKYFSTLVHKFYCIMTVLVMQARGMEIELTCLEME